MWTRNSIGIIDHDLNIKIRSAIPGEDEFLERGTPAEPLPHHLEVVVGGRENLEAGQLADTCRGSGLKGESRSQTGAVFRKETNVKVRGSAS